MLLGNQAIFQCLFKLTQSRITSRCHRRIGEVCDNTPPPVRDFGDGHKIACHLEPAVLKEIRPVFWMKGEQAAPTPSAPETERAAA